MVILEGSQKMQKNKQENAEVILPISVVIPTYSEEKLLPLLLESISNQVFKPAEVIVADAKSPDKTREIAKQYGVIVVEGGKIAFGRNAGAKVAKSEYLLFLDADTQLPHPTTLADAFLEYLRNEVDIASAKYAVDENNKENESKFGVSIGKILFPITNSIRHTQNVFQHPNWEGGAFIMIKKNKFDHLSGFDENLTIGEDQDLFQRAVKNGYKYRNLEVEIVTSTRRYNNPKKMLNIIGYMAIGSLLLGTGIYAGSKIIKKTWKMYGRLGGGKGKDPNE